MAQNYPGPRATIAVLSIESARLEARGTVSPYVKVILGKTEKKTTSKKGRTPVWKETLRFTYNDESSLQLHVCGNVILGSDDYIGMHDLNLFPILQCGRTFSGEIPLSSKKGKESGHVTLTVNFYPLVDADQPTAAEAPAEAPAVAAAPATAPAAPAAAPAAPAALPPAAAYAYPQHVYPQHAYPQQAYAPQPQVATAPGGQTTVIIVPGANNRQYQQPAAAAYGYAAGPPLPYGAPPAGYPAQPVYGAPPPYGYGGAPYYG